MYYNFGQKYPKMDNVNMGIPVNIQKHDVFRHFHENFCTTYDHLILVFLFKNRHKDFFACLASEHALGSMKVGMI